MEKILIILRGLPGAGKSTLAKHIVDSDFLICEADKYFVDEETGVYNFDSNKLKDAHKWCQDKVENYMKDSLINDQFYRKIVISNTMTMEWEMKPYFVLAEKYGYTIFTVIVENRHGGKNIHDVPEDKLEIMRNRFEFKL
jgi:predicted kinase